MNWKAALGVAALLLVAWLSLFFRYSLVPSSGTAAYAAVYVLDRWTGDVTVLLGVNSHPVRPAETR